MCHLQHIFMIYRIVFIFNSLIGGFTLIINKLYSSKVSVKTWNHSTDILGNLQDILFYFNVQRNNLSVNVI